MKKIIILTTILVSLLLSACSNEILDDRNQNIKKTIIGVDDPMSIGTENPKPADGNADCNLLNAEEVSNICNITLIAIKGQPTGDEVCIKQFMTSRGITMSFSYLDLGGTTPQQKIHCVNAMKGESLGENSCFAENAGNVAYVYDPYYTAVLKNDIGSVCSNEDLKQLAVLLESKIYS